MRSGAILAVAHLLAGCDRAAHVTPVVEADSSSSGSISASADASEANAPWTSADSAAPPPVPGWIHPARRVEAPAIGTTSTRDAFLAAHGVSAAKPDRSCFAGPLDLCQCDRSIAIPIDGGAIDALVCRRFVEGAPGSAVYMMTRTVLYVVDHGAAKIALDVPTEATVEAEDTTTGAIVGRVALRIEIVPGGISLVDTYVTDAGAWCPESVRRADAEKGETWPAIRQSYRAACASSGRYAFASGRFVRVPGQ
ncbi:hypothetical protein BH09MYX1_BH09MYX1_12490 [soil metagenome]